MRTLELTLIVAENRTLTLPIPPDIPPGAHRAVLVIDEQALPAGVVSGANVSAPAMAEPHPDATARGVDVRPDTFNPTDDDDNDDFDEENDPFWRDCPTHDVGKWPDNLSLRREDMYDDWGR